MSDFFGKLKSGAGKVAFEADKLNRLNKAKGELEKIKSQVQADYTKLGEMYYSQHATLGVSGAAYDEICQAIADLERQAVTKNDEIQHINAEVFGGQGQPAPVAAPAPAPAYTPPAPAPVAAAPEPTPEPSLAADTHQYCPNCHAELPAGVKFCPECGAKL